MADRDLFKIKPPATKIVLPSSPMAGTGGQVDAVAERPDSKSPFHIQVDNGLTMPKAFQMAPYFKAKP